MGMSDLPEIHTNMRAIKGPSVHISGKSQVPNIFHLGDSPASVGNYRKASQVNLSGAM